MTVMSGHEMYLQTAFMIADMFHVHAGHKLQILAIAIDPPWEFPSKDPRVTHRLVPRGMDFVGMIQHDPISRK